LQSPPCASSSQESAASQVNASQQSTNSRGQRQTDRRTCSPHIFFPHLQPADIPAYTPAPPKTVLTFYSTHSFVLSQFLCKCLRLYCQFCCKSCQHLRHRTTCLVSFIKSIMGASDLVICAGAGASPPHAASLGSALNK